MKTKQGQIDAVLGVIHRKMRKTIGFATTTDIATALVRAGYGNVKQAKKQAQIEVLNKLKERIETAIDTYYNSDGGGYYLAEDVLDDIDSLIKEAQNGNKTRAN